MVIISKAEAEKKGIEGIVGKNGRTIYIDPSVKGVRKPKAEKDPKVKAEKQPKVKAEKQPKKKVVKGVKVDGEFKETTDSGCVKPKKRIGKVTKTGKKRCAKKAPEV